MVEREKHPDVSGCVERLTDAAVADLHRLHRADPQIVRWCFKKMIHIERDPNAGEPLLGGLIGYRKITFGRRDWRVVWRVMRDDAGTYFVEIAEVWAAGYRKDSEVYAEVRERIEHAGSSQQQTQALSDILELFSKQARDLTANTALRQPIPGVVD